MENNFDFNHTNPPKPLPLNSKLETLASKDKVIQNKSLYTAKELYDLNISEIPMLVNPILLKSGITVFAGSSDVGKSTFLRQLCLAIARGDKEFLGWKLNSNYNKAIYVSTEDDRYAISYLLNKSINISNNGEKIEPNFLENLTYIFNTERLVEDLSVYLEKNKVDCVIIDAFTDVYSGDLNQANKVREFLNKFFILADIHNCLIIFLHHTGKRTEEFPPSKNNLLGSQGIEGKARQVIEFRRDPLDYKYRHLCIVKGNYITDELKQQSFKLRLTKNQTFGMTEDRTEFSKLVLNQSDKIQQKEHIVQKIVELRETGNTFENIAHTLTEEGFPIGKSTANNYYNEALKVRNESSGTLK